MSTFPKEYSEYYYYCKISNIEEAQQVFKNWQCYIAKYP